MGSLIVDKARRKCILKASFSVSSFEIRSSIVNPHQRKKKQNKTNRKPAIGKKENPNNMNHNRHEKGKIRKNGLTSSLPNFPNNLLQFPNTPPPSLDLL